GLARGRDRQVVEAVAVEVSDGELPPEQIARLRSVRNATRPLFQNLCPGQPELRVNRRGKGERASQREDGRWPPDRSIETHEFPLSPRRVVPVPRLHRERGRNCDRAFRGGLRGAG